MLSINDDHEFEFWLALASFAYVGFLKEGRGAVLVKRFAIEPITSANVDHHLLYVPVDVAKRTFKRPQIELLDEYEPEDEAVLLVLDTQGSASFMLLTEDNLGLPPEEAYMSDMEQGASAFMHGQLLRLAEPFDDVRPGYYVFLERKNGMLSFARAERNDKGDFVRTDLTHRLHLDFELMFEPVIGVVVS